MTSHAFSRRDLLKSGGALVVSFALGRAVSAQTPAQGGRGGPRAAPLDVDSFLAVHADGSVTIFTSRVDPGTGLTAVYRQLAAEELGIPVERFTVIQGDTGAVPDHGGTGGSSGVPRGGADIRHAAATARRALLELGAKQLQRPVADLTLAGGEVRLPAGGEGVAIAKLIGDRRFGIKVDANAPLKPAASFEVIGKPVMRTDVPGKATGRNVYVQDFVLPGMAHGRVIRPPAIGARLISVDETSIRNIPGIRVVRVENFLGVVADDEWAAVRGARELKATWSEGQSPFRTEGLDRAMASAPALREQTDIERGDSSSLAPGARQFSATYYWPFHGHTSLAPSCAIADVKESGTTVWSSTQNTLDFGISSPVYFASRRKRSEWCTWTARGRTAATARTIALAMRSCFRAPPAARSGCSGCERTNTPGIPKVRRNCSSFAPDWMRRVTCSRGKAGQQAASDRNGPTAC